MQRLIRYQISYRTVWNIKVIKHLDCQCAFNTFQSTLLTISIQRAGQKYYRKRFIWWDFFFLSFNVRDISKDFIKYLHKIYIYLPVRKRMHSLLSITSYTTSNGNRDKEKLFHQMHYGAYRCQRVNINNNNNKKKETTTATVEWSRDEKKMNSMNVVIRQLALFITIFSDVECNSVLRSTEICDHHIYHMRHHWVSFVEVNLLFFHIFFSLVVWWCCSTQTVAAQSIRQAALVCVRCVWVILSTKVY